MIVNGANNTDGDPLSPFLFTLAMEGFNSMMRIALQNRWVKGFKMGSRGEENMDICHLLYANDTVIFCEPDRDQISLFLKLLLACV